MTFVVDLCRNPDITEEEIRRRLAACYDLLLDLAEKCSHDTPDGSDESNPACPDGQFRTDCQELSRTAVMSNMGEEMHNRESRVLQNGYHGTEDMLLQRRDSA